MLTVATIDFVNHLRAATVGWRIEPAVLLNSATANDQIIDIVKPPSNISFTNFFVNQGIQDQGQQDQDKQNPQSVIKIKIEKQRLTYFIQCKLVIDRKPMLELSYWRGTGWLQTAKPTSGRYRRSSARFKTHECADDKISYHVYKIDRVKKGVKNRGTKRPGTPDIIYCDRVDLSDPKAACIVAQRTIWTLTKAILVKLSNNYSKHHVYVYTTDDDSPEEITDTHTLKQSVIQYAE